MENNFRLWKQFHKSGDYVKFINVLEKEEKSIRESKITFLDIIREENLTEGDK